jgi:Na+/melibiose symporter-like transporter
MYAFNGFTFIVYTIGFGMPGTLVGAAVFMSLALDAITDPWVGYLSDRWQSKWGRRHPFILFSAIPVGICIFLVFAPPAALLNAGGGTWTFLGVSAAPEQWGLFAWLMVFGSLLKLFITFYTLPHVALGSELSSSYLERTRIFRYNTLFLFGGSATLVWLFYNVFFSDGPRAAMNTLPFAGALAVFATAMIFLTGFTTRDQIPRLRQPTPAQIEMMRGFLKNGIAAFRNRNYRMLFFGLMALAPMLGIRETIGANMSLYYWEFPPRLIGYLPFFSMSSIFLGLWMVPKLNEYFEKSGTMRLAASVAAIAACLPVVLRSLGLLPENGASVLFVLVGVCLGLYTGSLAVLTTTVYSSISDVADEQELETGRRQEGVLFALRTFFGKLTVGVGHLIAGIAIDIIGFPPGAAVGEVEPQSIFQLGLVDGPIACLPVALAIYFYGRYTIDRRQCEANVLRLKGTVS